MNHYEKRVAAGAKFLDDNTPGWEHFVDPGTLSMGSCSKCILGQVIAQARKTDALRDAHAMDGSLGFWLTTREWLDARMRLAAVDAIEARLARLWLYEIHKRLPNLPRPLLPIADPVEEKVEA